MTFIPLTSGAYQNRSIIASAQRCLNLYPEGNPQGGEPYSVVHLCTPGLTLLSTAPREMIRCLYTASSGHLFACAGVSIYYIDPTWKWNLIGNLVGSATSDSAPRYTPVSMTDSNLSVLIADGSIDGWTIALVDSNNNILAPSAYVLTRISSTNNIVTGTVANPVVVPGTTIIIDTVTVTMGASDISAESVATDIIAAKIPNITASTASNGALVIKDTSGAVIIIGPGTANASLGFTDGQNGAYDPGGWTGADRVDFTDTYFVFNHPGTPIFGISGSEAVTFDSLDFAGKSDKGDNLASIAVVRRILWLIGTYTTECWDDTGGGGSGALSVNTFPFEEIPGTFFQVGCVAKYSVAVADNKLFFLGQNSAGRGIVMMSAELGTNLERISTHSIETAISKYPLISDAVAFTYQQQGHTFYVINFPTGDASWAFDATTKVWHERCWMDSNGKEHRIRPNTCAYAYGSIVAGDWESGNLYSFDLNNYTDNGMPIKRLRSFPHSIDLEANRRVLYRQFIANMQVGTGVAQANSQTVINTTFDASDGTLLQNYVGTGDIGSTFTQIDKTSNGQIVNDSFTGLGGTTAYLASGASLIPDYSIQFNVQPGSYTNIGSSNVYAIGRAVPTTYYGYKAAIVSNTTDYLAVLTVMPTGSVTTVVLGVLTSGYYAVTLTMQSVSVSMAVQRSIDGYWLTSAATWVNAQATAIIISDTTYKLPGRIVIGGSW